MFRREKLFLFLLHRCKKNIFHLICMFVCISFVVCCTDARYDSVVARPPLGQRASETHMRSPRNTAILENIVTAFRASTTSQRPNANRSSGSHETDLSIPNEHRKNRWLARIALYPRLNLHTFKKLRASEMSRSTQCCSKKNNGFQE